MPTSTSSKRSPSTAPPGESGHVGCVTATGRSWSGRCSCGSTRRRPACRSPRSSPRSTSCARRSRRWPGCSVARSRCTPTRWTRPWPCRPRRRRGSRLRTQQVIAHETNVAHVADPLGGSWYVEALTDEVERQAEELFAHLDELGGGSMLEGVIARDRGQLVPGPDRRFGVRPRAAVQLRAPHRRRGQRLHRGQRGRPDPAVADHQRRRGPPVEATRPGPPDRATRPPSTPRCAASRPKPPTRRST